MLRARGRADRLLEATGAIDRGARHQQYLDRLQVEKERGITGADYLLNLIDTPGHVDFSYEAQTVANFYLAFEQGLAIVPLLNKIDMAGAEPERVAQQLQEAFDIPPAECLRVSAKTGLGLEAVLPAVVERVPAPRGAPAGDPRLLLFDAYHDEYRWPV
eukprot:scaffold7.g3608.t1